VGVFHSKHFPCTVRNEAYCQCLKACWLFACCVFPIVATCLFSVLSVNFFSVEKMKPKLKAGGEEAVNHQTAISAGVFFQYCPLYSDFVFVSSKESRTKAHPYLKKRKAVNVLILFEEQIMISFLEDHFCSLL